MEVVKILYGILVCVFALVLSLFACIVIDATEKVVKFIKKYYF